MRDGFQLYLRYLAASLRAQLQYRASVVMQGLGILLITGIEFVGVWALFDRFGSVRGFTLAEVALLYGMVEISFALADALSRGFDGFAGMVRSGDFDRLLVRPRSTVLQLFGQELAVKRFGRLLQGAAVLLWAATTLEIAWSPARLLLLLAAIIGGVCLFCGISIVQATLAFWTVEPLEIMAAFSHGGVETGHYPLEIYRRWFRRFFTFVIPLGCVGYLPSLALLAKPFPPGIPAVLPWLAPLAGLLFLGLALQLWRLGVRKYVSTGS